MPFGGIVQDFLGGISSNSGNELTCVYQAGLEPQNIFCVGLMPGSSSSVPAGMTTTLLLFDNHGNEEPQFLQKHVAKYLVSAAIFTETRCKIPGINRIVAANKFLTTQPAEIIR